MSFLLQLPHLIDPAVFQRVFLWLLGAGGVVLLLVLAWRPRRR